MRKFILAGMALGLASCASPSVVEVVMPGDEELNCGQLKNAYAGPLSADVDIPC